MNPLIANKASFGRHETFPLRFGWVAKGYAACREDPNVFEKDDAIVTLGVGKNMISAIRYWITAVGVISTQGRSLMPTDLGTAIFSEEGWDPYLENDATIWLLHWLLAANATDATSMFWFFNRFHKPEFSAKELHDALLEFCNENITTRFSQSTLKHDVTLILRMYQPARPSREGPFEESLDSPLSTLGLITSIDGTRHYESRPEFRGRLPLAPFGFAVAEIFEQVKQAALPVEQFMHGDGCLAAPGSVFRLSQECLVRKLEELVRWLPRHFELRETAGIRQVYQLASISPYQVLRTHYEVRSVSEATA